MSRLHNLPAWLVPLTGAALLVSAFQVPADAPTSPDSLLSAATGPALAAAVGPRPGGLPDPPDPPGTILLAEPGSPFVAFNIWIRAGSQNDPEGKEGLAALTAALLSDGSTTHDPYQAIVEKLYPMAAGYGASVDKEMTVFTGTVHIDNLERYYELFRNALLSPAFDEADFDRVKQQTLNFLERGRRYNRDEELSRELLYWMAYRGTPYEHPEEGFVRSVRAITLDDVRAFYDDFYVRNNLVVGVGGGFPVGFGERVRADFDTRPAGEVPVLPAPDPVRPDRVKILIVEKETDATAISMGFPTDLYRGHPDFWAMKLVNSWFGEHRSSFSHLYQVIRERRGMNYGDYSYIEPFPNAFATQNRPVNASRRSNLFEIWIRPIALTEPGNLHPRTLFATRAALRELDRLVERGLPEDQIERTRRFLNDFSLNYGSTVARRLAYRVDDAFFGLGADGSGSGEGGYLTSIRPGLAALDKAAVDTAIRRHLASEGLYLVFITADAQALKALLLSGEETRIDYAGEQPAEVLAEDDEIAAWPIPVVADDIVVLQISEVFEGR
ncbi:MAG: insulinase family protein [Longimicrobiales bacterium]|nr:insulinase family protein [Longimicrobiales bacterium]